MSQEKGPLGHDVQVVLDRWYGKKESIPPKLRVAAALLLFGLLSDKWPYETVLSDPAIRGLFGHAVRIIPVVAGLILVLKTVDDWVETKVLFGQLNTLAVIAAFLREEEGKKASSGEEYDTPREP